jgi:hypothetical protein
LRRVPRRTALVLVMISLQLTGCAARREAHQRLLDIADQLCAQHVLGAQFRDDPVGGLGSGLQAVEQEHLLLRMMETLGKRVDVVDHCEEHPEFRDELAFPCGARELLQGVQNGGNRAVFVTQHADGLVHGGSCYRGLHTAA